MNVTFPFDVIRLISWWVLVVYQTERNIRCSYPIYIKNGFITLYNVTLWEDQTYTGQITYECNYGFETFNGNDQIQSECINGTWTYVGECQGQLKKFFSYRR